MSVHGHPTGANFPLFWCRKRDNIIPLVQKFTRSPSSQAKPLLEVEMTLLTRWVWPRLLREDLQKRVRPVSIQVSEAQANKQMATKKYKWAKWAPLQNELIPFSSYLSGFKKAARGNAKQPTSSRLKPSKSVAAPH